MSISYNRILHKNISSLKVITAPFANSAEHVQGPGGNTSVKDEGFMLIKSSGYTFTNVTEDNGVVLVEVNPILEEIFNKQRSQKLIQAGSAEVLLSLPETTGQKPSMEYEFHALLKRYVVHTHSVYVNVVACSQELNNVFLQILSPIEFLIVPYVTPGFPIASILSTLKQGAKEIPGVIILQNHGIIIHDDNYQKVLEMYRQVEEILIKELALPRFTDLTFEKDVQNNFLVRVEDIFGAFDFSNAIDILEKNILIPDQTIFFKDKCSDDTNSNEPLIIDSHNRRIIINGNEKFAKAAVDMLQAIQYIRINQLKLNLTPVYLSSDNILVLHQLPAEKHRNKILNN